MNREPEDFGGGLYSQKRDDKIQKVIFPLQVSCCRLSLTLFILLVLASVRPLRMI